MRIPVFSPLVAIFLSATAGSGEDGGQFVIDLDQDGEAEIISWRPFAQDEATGTFYRLAVTDSAGATIWEGPELKDDTHPMIFGEWHFGVSMPQMAADIDDDGKIELVTPEPQSDVSPTWFRVLEWRQGRFYQSRSAALLETPKGSGKFVWTEGEEYIGTWISKFIDQNLDGSFEVNVFTYDGGENVDVRPATVIPIDEGFQLRGNGVGQSMPPREPLEAWITNQRWYIKLSDSMPKGVFLGVEIDEDDPAWTGVGIREFHAPDSGFDPDVAPMVGHFRVSADRKEIQWFNLVNTSWETMADFFESRGINLLAE